MGNSSRHPTKRMGEGSAENQSGGARLSAVFALLGFALGGIQVALQMSGIGPSFLGASLIWLITWVLFSAAVALLGPVGSHRLTRVAKATISLFLGGVIVSLVRAPLARLYQDEMRGTTRATPTPAIPPATGSIAVQVIPSPNLAVPPKSASKPKRSLTPPPTPTTARTVSQHMENSPGGIQVGGDFVLSGKAPVRYLRQKESECLAATLGAISPEVSVRVETVASDAEALQYATEINDLVGKSRKESQSVIRGLSWLRVPQGMNVCIHSSEEGVVRDAAERIREALQCDGAPVTLNHHESWPANSVVILVGVRPIE